MNTWRGGVGLVKLMVLALAKSVWRYSVKLVLTLAVTLVSTEVMACKIYNSAYGGTPIGRVEAGKVYNQSYGGSPIGRVEAGKIYNRTYGGKAVGRVEGGKIYNQAYGGAPIGRLQAGKIFNQSYGGSPVGRGEGCGQMSLGAAFLLLF